MSNRIYYERRDKGLCPMCGSERDDRFIICSLCRSEMRQREARGMRSETKELISNLPDWAYTHFLEGIEEIGEVKK